MSCEIRNLAARFSLVLAVALMARSVTFGQAVRVNYMPGTDFSKYHAYKWVSIEGGGHPNQIVDAEIKQSIDSQMAAKGFTKADNDTADLYVGYQIFVDQEKQWNAYGMGGGVGWGGMGTATSSTLTSELLYWICMAMQKAACLDGSCYQGNEPEPEPGKEPKKLRQGDAKTAEEFPAEAEVA